jgi:hypothetical protein
MQETLYLVVRQLIAVMDSRRAVSNLRSTGGDESSDSYEPPGAAYYDVAEIPIRYRARTHTGSGRFYTASAGADGMRQSRGSYRRPERGYGIRLSGGAKDIHRPRGVAPRRLWPVMY